MKKGLYFVTALAGIMSAQAETLRTSLDGFSIGLQGGYGIGESTADRNTTRVTPMVTDHSNVSQRGALGGANIEYGRVFNNTFFAGLQVSAIFGNVKGDIKTSINAPRPILTSVKLKDGYGVALRLGKTVARTVLPYVKVGIVTSKWESITDGISTAIGKGSASKRRTGWELGAGVDFSVTECVAVGAEVSHLQYQKLSYDVRHEPSQIVTRHVQVKPRENRIMFRVKYKLGD
ncbi:MAG: outer membrane beta-barrel protein [Candidatus Paracaedimonas acanthamoebae]|uniref:Outer membrane beta-barrel protein n=1 Tax=Candidatus Paracaedimonas acanthamoebae TaxID=244581 RepID=A0A8J7TTT6_9PROT|nr:outer membrane beta-barrel protein [Candidatus Paracaedimonas acanthamoebae]